MAEPIYNNPEDLKRIQNLLLPGEEVEAVFDLTDPKRRQKREYLYLIAITTNRVIRLTWNHHDYYEVCLSIPYQSVRRRLALLDGQCHVVGLRRADPERGRQSSTASGAPRSGGWERGHSFGALRACPEPAEGTGSARRPSGNAAPPSGDGPEARTPSNRYPSPGAASPYRGGSGRRTAP